MIRAVLVLAWYTCALPSPDRPCVEIETKTFSSSLEAVRAYWKADEALDRKLYFFREDVATPMREYMDPPFPPKETADAEFERILRNAKNETDAKLCDASRRNNDYFAIKVFCK